MWNFSDLSDLAKKAQELQTSTGGMFNLDNMMNEAGASPTNATPPPPATMSPTRKAAAAAAEPTTTSLFSTPSPTDLFASSSATPATNNNNNNNKSFDAGKLFNSLSAAALEKPASPEKKEEVPTVEADDDDEEEEWDFDEEDLQVDDDPQQQIAYQATSTPLFQDQPAHVDMIENNEKDENDYEDEFDFGTDDEEEEEVVKPKEQQHQQGSMLPLEVSFERGETAVVDDPFALKEEPAVVDDPFAINENELITTMRTGKPVDHHVVKSTETQQRGITPKKETIVETKAPIEQISIDPFAMNESEMVINPAAVVQTKQQATNGLPTPTTETQFGVSENQPVADTPEILQRQKIELDNIPSNHNDQVYDTVAAIEKDASANLNLAPEEKAMSTEDIHSERNLVSATENTLMDDRKDDNDEYLQGSDPTTENNVTTFEAATPTPTDTISSEEKAEVFDKENELSKESSWKNNAEDDLDDMYDDDVNDMYADDDDDDSSSDGEDNLLSPKNDDTQNESDDATPRTGAKPQSVEKLVKYYDTVAFKPEEDAGGDEGLVSEAAAEIDASEKKRLEEEDSKFSFSNFSSTLNSLSSQTATTATNVNEQGDINAEKDTGSETLVAETPSKNKEGDNIQFSFSKFSSTLGSLQSQAASAINKKDTDFSFSKFSSTLGPLTSQAPPATNTEQSEEVVITEENNNKNSVQPIAEDNAAANSAQPTAEDNAVATVLPTQDAEKEGMSLETPIAGLESNNHIQQDDDKMVPATVLDRYTDQMQRSAEYHSNELLELEKKHARDMQQSQQAFFEQIQQYQQQLEERNKEWEDVMRSKEGMSLKVDMLKRELHGTQKLLKERDASLSSIEGIHQRTKQLLEDQMKEIQENAGTAKADVYQVQSQLKMKNLELAEANENYAALKARVKVVATELKERRIECRNLGIANNELNDLREQMESEMANLTSKLDDRNRSNDETITELDDLREQVKVLEQEVKEAEGKVQLKSATGDQALSAYKKKAQNSLAVANARTAAAAQAREEAELEARAARQTADEAVERAREAEAISNSRMEEAKGYVTEMEESVAKFQTKADEDANRISALTAQVETMQGEIQSLTSSRDALVTDVAVRKQSYNELKSNSVELQTENANLQQRTNNLYDEVETLREELRKSATKAFMAQTDNTAKGTDSNYTASLGSGIGQSAEQKSESEATILMLQGELKDANVAIKELKETLRSHLQGGSKSSSPMRSSMENPEQQKGNDSTPLFYAMEKQAELSQAHNEINRLATLLGELESEKMDAFDRLEHMKAEKNLAEARLERFEKLGGASSSSNLAAAATSNNNPMHQQHNRHNTTSRRQKAVNDRLMYLQAASQGGDSLSMNSWGSGPESDSMRMDMGANSMDLDHQDNTTVSSGADANVNLEYLKNVMLSYLKAKTYNERKRLIPALSAVLCLTPEESIAAMKSVEESGSVESVGMSLFENLGSRAGLKLL